MNRDLDPIQLALQRLGWSSRLSETQRAGLTHRQFVRRQLTHLGVGRDLMYIVPPKGDRRYRLPSEDDMRAQLANLNLDNVEDQPMIG